MEKTAAELGADPRATAEIQLAVDEAATNIILHGYRGQPGTLEIEFKRERDDLIIHIRDTAEPFDPTSVQPPDLTLPLEKRDPGGLGVHLMRQTMDEIRHRLLPQGGNELTFVRKIRGGEDKA